MEDNLIFISMCMYNSIEEKMNLKKSFTYNAAICNQELKECELLTMNADIVKMGPIIRDSITQSITIS